MKQSAERVMRLPISAEQFVRQLEDAKQADRLFPWLKQREWLESILVFDDRPYVVLPN